MAVPKFEYFPTRAAFDTARGATTTFNNSVVFIEDTMELFTHGHFWTVSNLSQYYNSTTQKLQLKNGNTVISELDASPFIKDGMLDSVELVTTAEQGDTTPVPYLKLTFNTVQDEPTHTVIKVSIAELFTVYNGDNVLLSSNYAKASTYTEPAAGDKVDIAVGKLAKGVADNAAAIATKQATITGAATTITSNNLTASRVLVSDANGKVADSSVTSTELGYLSGVTSSIQTQLNSKANIADLGWVEH